LRSPADAPIKTPSLSDLLGTKPGQLPKLPELLGFRETNVDVVPVLNREAAGFELQLSF
jgi:hypothetical protein